MKASQIPLFTSKEISKEAQVKSHQLLLKAGYIHKHASGLYSYLPFGLLTHQKIEQIVKEEMNKFGAIEIKLPILTQAEVWKKSGRWSEMGHEMMRLKDRHEKDYCLAPTHEEAVTQFAKAYLKSYKQLPINLYQIGTKYRDEIRPRYGLIRCREFIMKDAYSFHATEISLNETYQKMRECYRSIFNRCGISTISVQADSAGMGGAHSEEFMVTSEIGESTLLFAEDLKQCSYQANQEKTEFIPAVKYSVVKSSSPVKYVDTPNISSVEDVAKLLDKKESQFIKTLVYEDDYNIVIAFIPGDRNLSLTKLNKTSGSLDLKMASNETICQGVQVPPGFIGPHNLPVSHTQKLKISSSKITINKKILIYYDRNLKGRGELIAGGNQKDLHCIHLEEGRDFMIHEDSEGVDLVEAKEGDLCPLDIKQTLVEKKGIELGHIFKIGRKYSERMNFSVLDQNGRDIIPTMGCYGIGIDRTLQAYVEQNYDKHGIIWSKALSPYSIYFIPIFNTEEDLKKHERIYHILKEKGFNVYFDDRKERVGVKFNDADLVGFPWQIISGKKFLESGELELKNRRDMSKENLPLEKILSRLKLYEG